MRVARTALLELGMIYAVPEAAWELNKVITPWPMELGGDGYLSERLTNQVTGESEVRLNIQWAKAPLAAGIVISPSGEPAVGATLVVGGHGERVPIFRSGKLQFGQHTTGMAIVLQRRPIYLYIYCD